MGSKGWITVRTRVLVSLRFLLNALTSERVLSTFLPFTLSPLFLFVIPGHLYVTTLLFYLNSSVSNVSTSLAFISYVKFGFGGKSEVGVSKNWFKQTAYQGGYLESSLILFYVVFVPTALFYSDVIVGLYLCFLSLQIVRALSSSH